MMFRILLADHRDIVRRGLRQIIEEQLDWEVCAEAVNGSQAIDLALKHRPDIAILAPTMPGLPSLEMVRIMRTQLPETEVLICTINDSDQIVREILAAGARGYILISDTARDLVTAITSLTRHRTFLTSTISESLLNALLETSQGSAYGPTRERMLTARELQIVQMLASGKSNREIAGILSISMKTVETHRSTIMRKVGLNSIVELVHYAA